MLVILSLEKRYSKLLLPEVKLCFKVPGQYACLQKKLKQWMSQKQEGMVAKLLLASTIPAQLELLNYFH